MTAWSGKPLDVCVCVFVGVPDGVDTAVGEPELVAPCDDEPD